MTVKTKQVLTAIRLPEAVLTRLEKAAERLSEPGLAVTRSEALRRAVYIGLDNLETRSPKKKARPR